ncbi:MAG TPA: ABC transporter permease, partial [Polyangiaceae bacterium]|nr:ABC transporter permease [Polyangiaceae bacterium]
MSEGFAEQLERLPRYLGAHMTLVALALVLGTLIALPTAVLVAKSRARVVVLTVAGVVQTIPSLALLALMVPLLGAFGFWPALVALVLYSVLPMLRNTITGIVGVDPQLVEAARGLGMTNAQVLRRVELPLALPVIVAGMRTSAVWVVGVATLSTPVGQTSLGNYIFGGLQTRNWT